MTPVQKQTYRHSIWPLFDSEEPANHGDMQEAVKALAAHPLVATVLDASNIDMVVLNDKLQIVVANHAMEKHLGITGSEALIGKRIGEVLNCVNVRNGKAGCGAGENCSRCGASRFALEAEKTNAPAQGECLIVTGSDYGNRAFEYFIRATPVTLGKIFFSVISMQDISDRKRRLVLERVFIHDLSNTLTGLIGWSESLKEAPSEDVVSTATRIGNLTARLAREVEDHKVLLAVESNEYKPQLKRVSPKKIIDDLEDVFAHNGMSDGIILEKATPLPIKPLRTDPAIVLRVMTNMVKNACEAEAEAEDGRVRFGCEVGDDNHRFFVWNRTPIPDDIARNIFQRSFSTKAAFGRGLGTYSMKLFGERCLGGSVYFKSDPRDGTTFYLIL